MREIRRFSIRSVNSHDIRKMARSIGSRPHDSTQNVVGVKVSQTIFQTSDLPNTTARLSAAIIAFDFFFHCVVINKIK